MKEKPTFVREIEKHTGLECRAKEAGFAPEQAWEVLSPTGVALFTVLSHTDGIIGGITQPEMFEVQGISKKERSKRRREQQ